MSASADYSTLKCDLCGVEHPDPHRSGSAVTSQNGKLTWHLYTVRVWPGDNPHTMKSNAEINFHLCVPCADKPYSEIIEQLPYEWRR